jgi:hypothetical protein
MMQRLPLVAMLAMAGCGNYWTSNSVDLDAVEGAPVKVSQVRMRHSRVVGLASAPARLLSGDPPNAVGVQFSIDKLAATPPHAGVAARLSCRVDDFVVVAPVAHDASDGLSSLAPGASHTGDDTVLPSVFTPSIPTVCETTFIYMVRPPLAVRPIGSPEPDPAAPGPEAGDLRVGTTCLSDGTLRVGPCTSAELPRTPASAPLAISKLVAAIAPHDEGGFGVTASVLITTGPGAPPSWTTHGTVQCAADAAPVPLSMIAIGQGLSPGESVVDHGFTSPKQAWSERPTACTLRFQSAAGGERTSLGEHCVRDGETTVGACA